MSHARASHGCGYAVKSERLSSHGARWFDRDRPRAEPCAQRSRSGGRVCALLILLVSTLVRTDGFCVHRGMVPRSGVAAHGSWAPPRRSVWRGRNVPMARHPNKPIEADLDAKLNSWRSAFRAISAGCSWHFAQIGLFTHFIVRALAGVRKQTARRQHWPYRRIGASWRTLLGWFIGIATGASQHRRAVLRRLVLLLTSSSGVGCMVRLCSFGLELAILIAGRRCIAQKEFDARWTRPVFAIGTAIQSGRVCIGARIFGLPRCEASTPAFAIAAAAYIMSAIMFRRGRTSPRVTSLLQNSRLSCRTATGCKLRQDAESPLWNAFNLRHGA